MTLSREQQRQNCFLGQGVYSIPEAAGYTGLKAQRVHSWFKQQRQGRGRRLFKSDYDVIGRNRAVSFYDLIDVLIAGQFRKEGVSMRVVRSAYERLQQELGTEHPFCHCDLRTDGRDIFRRTVNEVGDERFAEVISGQNFFARIIHEYLRNIEYDKETKLALRWGIATGIVIDPNVSFGKPVVKNRGTTTYVLSKCFHANDSDEEFVADLFDVTPSDVRNAVNFETEFSREHAA